MEIKAIHDAAVSELINDDDSDSLVAAHRLLLEVLFAYGAAYSAITERLLADADAAELARAEGAEVAEQSRLAVLAGVSHELGNPLMIVKVNVASIRKFLEERGNWPEDLNQREADVSFAVERMMILREELLAASRNEQRELDVVPQPLHHTLRRVVRWGRLSADEKAIQITEDCAADLPYVLADEGALQSIFTNLLSNAVRYTGRGGSIEVRAWHEPPNLLIAFTDSGIGISEEDQLRIYERFFRTEEGKNAVVFGIGLGLAITRDLVSSMGGTITVESQLGSGSTFTVALPAADLSTVLD
jgi:signal transduction histidine kinase